MIYISLKIYIDIFSKDFTVIFYPTLKITVFSQSSPKLYFNLIILRRQSVIHCWMAWKVRNLRISVPCNLLPDSASAVSYVETTLSI